MIQFVLNQEAITTDLPSGMVLADYIRYHESLKGTKLGCREGDCGACTVLVGTLKDGKVVYESATSCLMPLGNALGKHIVTIEGLNLDHKLNVVQQAMTDEGGTQCGFCTPGFVVSLCGWLVSGKESSEEEGVLSVGGNICRCTGYKSIERAIGQVSTKLDNLGTHYTLEGLVEHEFLPAYFLDIPEQLALQQANQPINLNPNPSNKVWVGGGTDLYVQRPKEMSNQSIEHAWLRDDLKGIWKASGHCHIGASTSTEALKQSELIQSLSPDVPHFFNLISSLQIRNMATVAGNLVNASPIGDVAIFLLGLRSNIVLNEHGALREMPLSSFFKGYKTLDKRDSEFVQEVNFELPRRYFYFNFEKVSKRTYLDIASVNTAMSLQLTIKDVVVEAGLAVGGVAAVPKFMFKTVEYLKGKPINRAVLDKSLEIAQTEVSPISDVRGSAAYKRLLMRQLITAHYRKFFPHLYD